MKLKIITICTLILFGLTACGDGKEQPKHHQIVINENCADKFIEESVEGYYEYTELGVAIRDDDLPRVKTLVQNGACVMRVMGDETFQYDAIYAATIADQVDILKYLIDGGMDVNRTYDENGFGLLAIACNNVDPDIAYQVAKILLDAGAKVDGLDRTGYENYVYPLANAIHTKNTKLTKLLIDRGADITMGKMGSILNDKNIDFNIERLLLAALAKENGKISAHWIGNYSASVEYVGGNRYDLEILKDRCIFSTNGYEDLCLMREHGDRLEIIYIKDYSDGNPKSHEVKRTLANLTRRGGKYYLTGNEYESELDELPAIKETRHITK